MFGIGETELVIIVVFAFLLFGPDKLPGMGRTLGRVLRQFREASDGFTEVVQTNIMDPASEELEKSPKQRKREAEEAQGAQMAASPEAGEAAEEEAPARRETFAERKARLQAERKAAEQAARQADAATIDDANKKATVEPNLDSEDGGASPAEEVPRTTAADLYALSGQKSSRAQAAEAARAALDDVPREDESAAAPAPVAISDERGEGGDGEA